MKPTIRDVSPRSSATSGPHSSRRNNLHRNVIFRDDGTKASLVEPLHHQPPLGSPNPRDLWKWMAMYEEKTGGELLAIAHNGNLGNGTMFPIIESFTGKKIDQEYVGDARRTGNRSTKPPKSKATAKHIRSFRLTMSSPISSVGTKATST